MDEWAEERRRAAGPADSPHSERPPARSDPAEQGGEAQQRTPVIQVLRAQFEENRSSVNRCVVRSREEPEEEPTLD